MLSLDRLEQHWILSHPLSPVTASAYRSRLESLGRRGMDVDQVLAGDVDELAAWMARRRRSASIEAYRNELKAAKATTKALHHLQVIKRDVGKSWELPPDAPRRPQSLSIDELRRVLAWRHVDPATWHRGMAIVEAAFFADARRGELHRLDVDDLDQLAGTIRVQASKNHITAEIPVEPEAFTGHLQSWLEHRPSTSSRALFVSLHRPHGRLGPVRIYGILHAIGRDVGVRLNPNRLRHTRLRTLWKAGWPESLVQLIARHRGRNALQTYIEPSLEDAAERIRAGQGTGFLGQKPAWCPMCGQGWEADDAGAVEA